MVNYLTLAKTPRLCYNRNKTVQKLQVAHELQLVNYLTIAKKDIGILVKFGGDKIEIKRKYRLYTPKK